MYRLLLSLTLLSTLSAQERWQSRSMILTTHGVAATSQTLASQVAAQILARNGSAVDGDLFAIHYDAKSEKLTGLNASGWAPAKMTTAPPGGFTGIHSVTVPGAVDGWWKMHQKFGRLPWADLFAPAIHYARHGFPVTEIIHEDWATSGVSKWSGPVPAVGEIFKTPGLARAYEIIARQGRDGFYKGPLASDIIKTSQRLGGLLAPNDFTEYASEFVEPISTTYRGARVSELPPNGQGVSALEMLNIMELRPSAQLDLHYKIEAQKLSVLDLRRYVTDPKFATIPTATLLSKSFAAERAKLINPARARCDLAAAEPSKLKNTIYLAIVDKDGNMVSWIQSIFNKFGSGIATDDFGFHLHDRGGLFNIDPNHPNRVAPHKRPLHTIIPGFLAYADQRVAFGIMGGFNQAQAHAQFVSYLIDEKMNIQEAMESPRFTRPIPEGCSVLIENRFPTPAIDQLKNLGHLIDIRPANSYRMGGGQAVAFDRKTKVKSGASDPRKDGAAIPEPANFWKP